MKFIWKDNSETGRHTLFLYDDDGTELETMWMSDHTVPYAVENDTKYGFQCPYAFEVGYCKGFSMRRGFDKYEDYETHPGYHGTPTHTVEDIKRWCENYIAQMYLKCYQVAVATMDEKRRHAEWFEANGFTLDTGELLSVN